MADFVHPNRQKPPSPFCLITTRNKIEVKDLKDLSEIQRESFFCLVDFGLFGFESIQNTLN